MPQHDRMRLVRRAGESVMHIEDRIAVAVIGACNRVMVRDGDEPRPQIDMREDHSGRQAIERTAVVLAALAANLLLTLVALRAAGPIMRVMGAKVEAVITRLLGVLLAALAAQFVIDGIRLSLAGPIAH